MPSLTQQITGVFEQGAEHPPSCLTTTVLVLTEVAFWRARVSVTSRHHQGFVQTLFTLTAQVKLPPPLQVPPQPLGVPGPLQPAAPQQLPPMFWQFKTSPSKPNPSSWATTLSPNVYEERRTSRRAMAAIAKFIFFIYVLPFLFGINVCFKNRRVPSLVYSAYGEQQFVFD